MAVGDRFPSACDWRARGRRRHRGRADLEQHGRGPQVSWDLLGARRHQVDRRLADDRDGPDVGVQLPIRRTEAGSPNACRPVGRIQRRDRGGTDLGQRGRRQQVPTGVRKPRWPVDRAMAYHAARAHVGMQLPGGRAPAAFDPSVPSTLARGNDAQLVQHRRYRKMSRVLRLVPSRRASDLLAAARERQPPLHRRVVQVLRHLVVVESAPLEIPSPLSCTRH
jgi:hypothetical protein